MREMIFDHTSAFGEWFEETIRELAATCHGSTIKPSVEAIESGLVDFKDFVA